MRAKVSVEKKEKSVPAGTSLLTDYDIYLFREGNHFHLYDKLGAHPMTVDGIDGTYFAVWAPNAKSVSVVGDFNGWDGSKNPLFARWDSSGIWEGFIAGVGQGMYYKFRLESNVNGYRADRGDPFAFYWEVAPKTSPIIWKLDYMWRDEDWMRKRGGRNRLASRSTKCTSARGGERETTEASFSRIAK